MNIYFIANLLGFAAGFFGVVMTIFQAQKIYKSPDISGVSIDTWIVVNLTTITWFSFGILFNDLAQVISNIGAFLVSAFIIFMIVYRAPEFKKYMLIILIPLIYGFMFFITAKFVGINNSLNIYAISLAILIGLPQLLKAWKISINGISVASWITVIVYSLLWIIHAVILKEPLVIAASIINIFFAVGILCIIFIKTRKLNYIDSSKNIAN
jgi:uncharacterized protein with PQ loop repeat